jgi:hypothetical protein
MDTMMSIVGRDSTMITMIGRSIAVMTKLIIFSDIDSIGIFCGYYHDCSLWV